MTQLLSADAIDVLRLQYFQPSHDVSQWVQCYWTLGHGNAETDSRTEKLYPDAGASLTFYLDATNPWVELAQNRVVRVQSFSAQTRLLSVRFRPGGMKNILGIGPDYVNDQECVTGDSLPFAVVELSHQLSALPSYTATSVYVGLLEQFILAQLERVGIGDKQTLALIKRVAHSRASTTQIASELGMVRRTLERKLRNSVGFSAGELKSFYQMASARKQLAFTTATITEIAQDCGYYDQAHFCHAFRRFTLESPQQYRQRKLSQIYKPI